ncbi:MAG: F0F1 ATP synthase subunit alpha, partial [Abditibacteriota bacterium]|nr:F0F1 ATP synthase subunit alpha [Abditibacteriota bacterium]
GGGSLTALPIIETQSGDISAYIPTNVISITDGQIYLEPDLFYSGIRPAINVGTSVSRVGSSAQTKAMKKVTGQLKLDLAQYWSLQAFAQFASDLDKATLNQLARGRRIVEILKQPQYSPMETSKEVYIIFAATKGMLDDIPENKCDEYEKRLYAYMDKNFADLGKVIDEQGVIDDDNMKKLSDAVAAFTESFKETL